MFWTRAIPNAQMDPEQLKRNFNVVELPDAAVLLASAMEILSTALGFNLARSAVKILKPGGFIVLDNSDWYPNAARVLREADLIQVDFHDFRPQHHYRCTTSLFMHHAFRPKPRSPRLPLAPIGGKDVAATNAWDLEGHV